ncbi:MAG: hypothetical protein ACK5MR_16595, partial [Cumulibacter sp.]
GYLLALAVGAGIAWVWKYAWRLFRRRASRTSLENADNSEYVVFTRSDAPSGRSTAARRAWGWSWGRRGGFRGRPGDTPAIALQRALTDAEERAVQAEQRAAVAEALNIAKDEQIADLRATTGLLEPPPPAHDKAPAPHAPKQRWWGLPRVWLTFGGCSRQAAIAVV